MRKEIICIGVVVLFLLMGLNMTSAVGIKKEASNGLGSSLTFSDDFDDNAIDTNKWTEVYSDGTWAEKNKRCEFTTTETGTGGKTNTYEGIESKEIECTLEDDAVVIASADFVTVMGKSESNTGTIFLEVTDGENWVHIAYWRWRHRLYYRDSNDEVRTVLTEDEGLFDGKWTNTIQISQDGYRVTAKKYDSGLVEDPLFDLNPTLKVRIYIVLGGELKGLLWHAGFDNVNFVNTHLPETPTINGPSNAKARDEHTYTFVTNDPDNDQLYYYIDWGDGTNSGWKGKYGSGEEKTITHKWFFQGDYKIKIKAKDVCGAVSDWSTLEVSMPKTKASNNLFGLFNRFLYSFPVLHGLFNFI